MARTVDHISGGRLIRIGSGWFERDYDEYGYEFGTAGGALGALARDLPRIRRRWERPQPTADPRHPVLVGGGERTLRIGEEHADIWHGFGDADTIAHKHRVLDQRCARSGGTPTRSSAPQASLVAAGPLPEDARDYPAAAERLYAAGTRLFTVGLDGPRYDMGPLRDLVAWRDSRGAA